MQISAVSLLVEDQQQAVDFFLNQLGFVLREDVINQQTGHRWCTVCPEHTEQAKLVLQLAAPEQLPLVGKQAGEGVFLILETDDFERQYKFMRDNQVTFEEEPRQEPYGQVVIFKDICGNRWDLIQRAEQE